MPDKKNINKATKEDLKKIEGMTEEAADQIIKFKEEKGNINSIDELFKETDLPIKYVSSVEQNFTFQSTANSNNPKLFANPPKVLGNPVLLGSPSSLVQNSMIPIHNFTVKLNKTENATFKLEQLKVVIEHQSLIDGKNKIRNNKEFRVNSDGIANIGLFGLLASPIIDLLVYSSENQLLLRNSYNIEDIKDTQNTLEITLPELTTTSFDIHLLKETGQNYPGFFLSVEFELRDPVTSKLLQKKEISFEIFNKSILAFKYEHFGILGNIIFLLKNTNGEILLKQESAYAIIQEFDAFDFIFPSTTALDFKVRVIPFESPENPFAGYILSVLYDILDVETGLLKRKEDIKFELDHEGEAIIDINKFGIIKELQFEVHAPTGEIIARSRLKPEEVSLLEKEPPEEDLDTAPENLKKLFKINVSPKKIAALHELPVRPVRPKKTVGRAIDAIGEKKLENIQVILYVAEVEDPQDVDFYPVLSTLTESNGFFVFDTPQEPVTKAFARVGIKNAEGQPFDVPVRLEKALTTHKVLEGADASATLVTKEEYHKYIPGQLVIVINTGANGEEEDCGCDCKELDFHQPKRVLEEFSFYTAVRTTEPQIKGFTLEEDGEIAVQEIYGQIPSLNDADLYNSSFNLPSNFREQKIRKSILLKHLNEKKGISLQTLYNALEESNAKKLKEVIYPKKDFRAFGRYELDADRPIDWDEDPTIYQATTLAHGYLLHFKQEWMNDGYSIGDLLYSLPLAPGQKKQIVTFDWERREAASRTESVDYQEQLNNSLTRDRDINEVVAGSLSESITGGSTANSSGWSAAGGYSATGSATDPKTKATMSWGSLIGVSGGSSKASSDAWQNSSRDTSMNSLQKIRDRTIQSANAIRSQRSTVIQTVTQGERFSVEAETIANYNHCHAVTFQFFQVQRHLRVEQRLADIQECLFVPLLMDTFDNQKILRWKEELRRYVWNRNLQKGFAAIERIENNYEGSDLPFGKLADENIEYLDGHLNLRFQLAMPRNTLENAFEASAWNWYSRLGMSRFGFGSAADFHHIHLLEKANAVQIFQSKLAPKIAEEFVQSLHFEAITDEGPGSNEVRTTIPIDATLVSQARGGNSYVSLRIGETPNIKRSAIKYIEISSKVKNTNPAITDSNGNMLDYIPLLNLLPDESKVIVDSGSLRYRTRHLSFYLFRDSRIQNDLTGLDTVKLYTPMNSLEMRNPRNEDIELATALKDHLNNNVEFYHQAIWMNMSPQRLFMMLDGIRVTDYSETKVKTINMEADPPVREVDYPEGIVRSVASVTENRVIGVVGNSVILPVAPGYKLDPNLKGQEVDLFSLFKPAAMPDPIRITLPTKGVFAESVMGKCNSCEKKEEDRFWRWEESPIPDSPTAIQPISTDSRGTETGDLKPSELPTPMINIQNAPNVPDPQGVGIAANLLQQPAFDNITGLAGNQQNAAEALAKSFETTRAFGEKAADLAALSAQLNAIKEAKANNLISSDDAGDFAKNALKNYNEKPTGDVGNALNSLKQIKDMVDSGELDEITGKDLIKNVIDGISNKQTKILDSPAYQNLINRAADKGDGKIKASAGDESFEYDPFAETTLGWDPQKKKFDEVTPEVVFKQQTKAKGCWATVATMMSNWKWGESLEIDEFLEKYANISFQDIYENNLGLELIHKNELLELLGLIQEAPTSFSPEGLRELIKKYGPIWITTDENLDENLFSIHAKILVGVQKDSSDPDNILLKFIDPLTGHQNETYEIYNEKFQQGFMAFPIQIVHFPEKTTEGGIGDFIPKKGVFIRKIDNSTYQCRIIPGTQNIGITWNPLQFPLDSNFGNDDYWEVKNNGNLIRAGNNIPSIAQLLSDINNYLISNVNTSILSSATAGPFFIDFVVTRDASGWVANQNSFGTILPGDIQISMGAGNDKQYIFQDYNTGIAVNISDSNPPPGSTAIEYCAILTDSATGTIITASHGPTPLRVMASPDPLSRQSIAGVLLDNTNTPFYASVDRQFYRVYNNRDEFPNYLWGWNTNVTTGNRICFFNPLNPGVGLRNPIPIQITPILGTVNYTLTITILYQMAGMPPDRVKTLITPVFQVTPGIMNIFNYPLDTQPVIGLNNYLLC